MPRPPRPCAARSTPNPAAAAATAALVALLAANASPATAGTAEQYRLDPVHTRVEFAVSHAGYSQAIGTVSGSQGALAFDPDDWSSAVLRVRVPLRRIDMGDDGWTRAVLEPRILDAQRYPFADFVSERVEPVDERHARICGTLTLHASAQPVCLDVSFNQRKRYPLPPFRTTVGFSATATLSRAAFGITSWKSLIGDAVSLRIEAEAIADDDALRRFDAEAPHMRSDGMPSDGMPSDGVDASPASEADDPDAAGHDAVGQDATDPDPAP